MKKLVIHLFLLVVFACFFQIHADAQNNEVLYMKARTFKDSMATRWNDQIQYYDDFGRPIQLKQVAVTPNGADLVNLTTYDEFNRVTRTYIPAFITGSDHSSCLYSTFLNASNSYLGSSGKYNMFHYNNPHSDDPAEIYQPGFNISTKIEHIVSDYEYGHLTCDRFKVAGNGDLQLDGIYYMEELSVTQTTNEDDQITLEFQNSLGQIILNRKINGYGNYDTYYVYDDLGNLRYVIPPQGLDDYYKTRNINLMIANYAYVYDYDKLNRCISKKLPGAEPVYYVYDNSDRPVMSQDGNMREKCDWIYTIYDDMNRVKSQSLVNDERTRQELQNIVAANGSIPGFQLSEKWDDTVSVKLSPYILAVYKASRHHLLDGYFFWHIADVYYDSNTELIKHYIDENDNINQNFLYHEDSDFEYYYVPDEPYVPGYCISKQIIDEIIYILDACYGAGNHQWSTIQIEDFGSKLTEINVRAYNIKQTTDFPLLQVIEYDDYNINADQPIPSYLNFEPISLYGNVIISEIMYDSPLNEQIATGNPYSNGEYVELYNSAATAMDLTGWKMTGGGSTETYNFPDGTVIEAKSCLIIAYQHKDSGFSLGQLYPGIDSAAHVLYQRNVILSNSGETISIIDDSGSVVDSIFYDGTSNKSKSDRLSAENANDCTGAECLSLHRIAVDYDSDGYAIACNEQWVTATVSPFMLPDACAFDNTNALGNPDTRTKGLKTYEKVAVIDGGQISDNCVERAFYYDYKNRLIQTVERNHLGGISRYSNVYDFVGNTLAAHESHRPFDSAVPDVKLSMFTYDHGYRMVSETVTLNNAEPTKIGYSYDELGRLSAKTYPVPVSKTNIDFEDEVYLIVDHSQYDLVGSLYRDKLLSCFYPAGNTLIDHFINENGELNPDYQICPIENAGANAYYYYLPELNSGYDDYIWGSTLDDTYYPAMLGYFNSAPNWLLAIVNEQKSSETTLLTERYTYNIQGWLTEKKSNVFDMQLRYYDPQKSNSTPSYTGNITEWEWKHKNVDDDEISNTYAFSYDKLNRLTNTKRYEGSSNTPTNSFTEQGISYDKNGNMLAMTRYMSNASEPSDAMIFSSYDGNQLMTMINNDASYGYEYDPNGNMITDGYNALKLNYNFLNLTSVVSDTLDNIRAKYSWLADGTKLGVKNSAGTSGYEYLGSLAYKYVNSELQLESAGFGGGRITVSNGSSGAVYVPNYYITDHLGSTRVICDGSGNISRSDFLPFGTRWNDAQAALSRYQFTGYEDQELLDNKYMDAGFRFYNGMGFNTIDPLAEDYPWASPYAYCANNPVRYIDPNGLAWKPIYEEDENGNSTRVIIGYKWVPEDESYDTNGNLFEGLYNQAIFFSHNGTFDASSENNIGSSTAYVFLAEGFVLTFDACTYPSDLEAYPTIPEGEYLAVFGKHKGEYEALRISDDGTYWGCIELGTANPAFSDGRTYAQGVNIHKAGNENLTAKTSSGSPVSAGCFLIDVSRYDNFISLFGGSQSGNTVHIGNSRTYARPQQSFRYHPGWKR